MELFISTSAKMQKAAPRKNFDEASVQQALEGMGFKVAKVSETSIEKVLLPDFQVRSGKALYGFTCTMGELKVFAYVAKFDNKLRFYLNRKAASGFSPFAVLNATKLKEYATAFKNIAKEPLSASVIRDTLKKSGFTYTVKNGSLLVPSKKDPEVTYTITLTKSGKCQISEDSVYISFREIPSEVGVSAYSLKGFKAALKTLK